MVAIDIIIQRSFFHSLHEHGIDDVPYGAVFHGIVFYTRISGGIDHQIDGFDLYFSVVGLRRHPGHLIGNMFVFHRDLTVARLRRGNTGNQSVFFTREIFHFRRLECPSSAFCFYDTDTGYFHRIAFFQLRNIKIDRMTYLGKRFGISYIPHSCDIRGQHAVVHAQGAVEDELL